MYRSHHFSESLYDIFIQDPLTPTFRLLVSAFFIFLLYKWISFLVRIYRKKLLIDAFAQQVTDEIERTDIQSAIDKSARVYDTSMKFVIEGMLNLYKEQRELMIDISSSSEAEVFAKVAESVADFNNKTLSGFLYERTTLRWCIDGLEALIGDYKSMEVAWAKGTRYLNRFIPEDKRSSLPWMPTYMKLLGLPYDFNATDFVPTARKAMLRHHAKGYLTLLIASRFFSYRKRLKLFGLRGEDAWKEILRFKASNIDFAGMKAAQ